MRGYMVSVAVALVLLVAGCTTPADSEDDSSASTSTSAVAAGWTIDNSGSGCREAFLLVPMAPEDVARHLPEGYVPGDLQAMFGAPVATGSSGGFATAYTCPDSAYADATLLAGEWGFVVEAPQVAGVNESRPQNLYVMQAFTDNPELAAALATAGVAGAAIAPSVTVDIHPTGSSIARASYVDEEGSLAVWQIAAPVPAPFSATARFWHSAQNGTVYGDYHVDAAPSAQGSAMCTFRSGSLMAEAFGFTECTGHGVVGLTLNGATWESEYVFVPGVWAT